MIEVISNVERNQCAVREILRGVHFSGNVGMWYNDIFTFRLSYIRRGMRLVYVHCTALAGSSRPAYLSAITIVTALFRPVTRASCVPLLDPQIDSYSKLRLHV